MKPSVAMAVAGVIVAGSPFAASAQDAADAKAKKDPCKAVRKEKWAAKTRELATAADTDKDGSLSEAEFDPLRATAKAAGKELKKACEMACGVIKEEKPKEAKPPKAPKTPDPAKEKAKAEKKAAENKPWDKDGDGKLNADEEKAKKDDERKKDLAKDFKKADNNGDGKLSIDEAVKAIK
jgi:hypothetical protein